VFAARRQRFREAMEPGSIALFVGARTLVRSGDTEFPFRQDSDFWYLTGFDQPDAVAVLRADGDPGFTLFVLPRDPGAETWTGYRPGTEGAIADYGADAAFPVASLKERLPGLLEGVTRIHHSLGRDTALDANILAVLDDQRRRSRTGVVPPSEIVDPRARLHEMRLRKEPHEIECMRRAAAITAAAHQGAARIAQGGRFEYELQAELEYAFRRLGGSGPAYGSIVGGGQNATVLHYIANDQPLRDGDLVLIDAGVEFEGYAADVTRTYPVGGRFEGYARAVYEVVLAAQEAALAACRPGTDLDAIHEGTLRSLVEGMIDLGFFEGPVDAAIEAERFRPYYMHRTSHWLGLDVHDVGSYSRDGKPRPLEAGMAFTVEPGLYVPMNSPDPGSEAFRGIGVRIEDDVIVTESGIENLNLAIPKQIEALEAWVRGD